MKSMLGNPIRTKSQFSAGGDRIPIQTRSSGQSVRGFGTQGLPVGTTKLGAYRMGDSDGNAPPSAIYPDDIFSPIPARDRQYPQVTFENVGNRVFQPDEDSVKLHALLKRLGDQKFKATENAPFADYFAAQRLAREIESTARTATAAELGHSREILRNIVDTRRKQANDDYLRKMLDAGFTLEDAQSEIENVRRANALQESRVIDDRPYQSKLLLSRLAQSRGVIPSIQEPLTSTTAIESPQRSQAMSSMLGMPGEGFATSPLDTARQFLTPDFYRRFLRRSRLTQEAGDEQAAIANLIASGDLTGDEVGTFVTERDPDGVERMRNIGSVTSGAVVPSTLSGMARENAIEGVREMYASRVESLRKKKILIPLPPILFGDRVIAPLYSRRSKEAGDKARFSVEVYQDLPTFQKILAINQLLATDPDNVGRLTRFLQTKVLTQATVRGMAPVSNIREILAEAGLELLGGLSTTLRIPYPTDGIEVNPEMIVRILEEFKMSSKTDLAKKRADSNAYSRKFEQILLGDVIPDGEAALGVIDATLDNNTAVPQTVLTGEPTRPSVLEIVAPAEEEMPRRELESMTVAQLKALAIERGLPRTGNKAEIIQRLRAAE